MRCRQSGFPLFRTTDGWALLLPRFAGWGQPQRLNASSRPVPEVQFGLLTSPYPFRFMSKKRKRISRRRLAGQRVLAHVPTFNLETGSHKPVTAARRYIAEQALVPPAILNVRRNEHTTDRFFWGEKGLFSAQYAEENHFLFPSLRLIVDRIGEDVLFEGIEALAADDWEEMEEYEYAFV